MSSPPLSSPSMTAAASRVTCAIGDERTANRIVDILSESVDGSDVAVAAFERPDGRWDVTMYFSAPPDQDAVRHLILLTAGPEIASTATFDTVAAQDWVRSSLEGLAPVRAGRFMVHGQHDRERVPPNKLGIEIEAALAFGTGHHGTTRGCLLLLDQVLRQRMPERVLDLGSGTGVLAIAAAKARQRRVFASDIDGRAVLVARENAKLNGVGRLVHTVCATGFSAPSFAAEGPFDLVLANILAAPLRRLAYPMSRYLAPSAFVVLSGLLPHQADSVIVSYRAHGLKLVRRLRLDGWASLLMQRM
ncbi:MAG: 50S ribosomal protein L11 methyltransferase [Afipia sp.]|nr:50S ribosomal protein L11 methyltransferase [Afipia sp.]OJW64517.1 MAG: ribosomal protein L11 methyltransferase [Afipia sp. 64-13]